jgi:hypothetical protein
LIGGGYLEKELIGGEEKEKEKNTHEETRTKPCKIKIGMRIEYHQEKRISSHQAEEDNAASRKIHKTNRNGSEIKRF